MKTAIPLTVLVGIAASAAIAPAHHTSTDLIERQAHLPEDHEPTVDATSTRGQWVTSYSNKPGVGTGPTVDKTSTRGQWVTSYSNNKEDGSGMTVDATSTRGEWVSSYSNDHEPTVDETSTRGKWVSSYTNKKWTSVEHADHWLPTGPAYLDMNTLEEGYKAHLMIMHDSGTWLHSGLAAVKRWLADDV